MKLSIILIAGLALAATVGCGESTPVDLGGPYAADQLIQARSENASRFDLEWKGERINITGVVDRVDGGNIYLLAGDHLEGVALDDLNRQEQAKWNPGDTVEYACEVGNYVLGTIFMEDCDLPEHGVYVRSSSPIDSIRDAYENGEILKYWSIPALLIVSVLTVMAIARSTWKEWQPAIIAIMCLGVLAILNDASTVVLGYTTVDSEVLTILAAISFPINVILAWLVLDTRRFASLGGTTPEMTVAPSTPVYTPQPDSATATVSPPGVTSAPDEGATIAGSPDSTVAAAVLEPSQTIAMQPSVASSMAWLVVTKGPSEGKSLQLKEGVNTIGRSLENDLQIDDASVSRSHAMVIVGDDRVTLTDLGSAGGTRIGERRISGKSVGDGSVITVGQTRFSLVNVDAFQGGPSSGATMVGSPSGSSLSLIAQSGPDAGASFLLSAPRNVIGRDPSAEVELSDPTVSRRHALLRIDADRSAISDLGSRSGTQVDGEMITGVQISIGDNIAIGQSEFTLMRPGG